MIKSKWHKISDEKIVNLQKNMMFLKYYLEIIKQ